VYRGKKKEKQPVRGNDKPVGTAPGEKLLHPGKRQAGDIAWRKEFGRGG